MRADLLSGEGGGNSHGWWSDLDRELLRQLATRRIASVDELAAKLAMPESAVSSLLCMLAAEGKIRIRVVELAEDAWPLS